jgi:uncharacterized damage-inducible protein DinB
MGSVKAVVKSHMEAAFNEGKGIFADSLLDAIKELNAEQAAFKPEGTEHSVGAIVNHITYWKNLGIGQFPGATAPEGPSEDWQAVTDDAGWAKTVEHLKQSQAAMLNGLEKLSDDDMDKKPETEGWPEWKEIVLGFAAHDVYHTAQIVKLNEIRGT